MSSSSSSSFSINRSPAAVDYHSYSAHVPVHAVAKQEDPKKDKDGVKTIVSQMIGHNENFFLNGSRNEYQYTLIQEGYEKDIVKLKEKISLAEAEKDKLSNENAELESAIKEVEKLMVEKTKKLEELDKLESPTESQKKEAEDLRKAIVELDNKNKESIGQILLNKKKIEDLEDAIEKMKDSRDKASVALADSIAKDRLKMSQLQNGSGSLQKKINDKQTEIEGLQEKLTLAKDGELLSLMNQITTLKKEKEELMIERDSLKDQLGEANGKNEELQQELEKSQNAEIDSFVQEKIKDIRQQALLQPNELLVKITVGRVTLMSAQTNICGWMEKNLRKQIEMRRKDFFSNSVGKESVYAEIFGTVMMPDFGFEPRSAKFIQKIEDKETSNEAVQEESGKKQEDEVVVSVNEEFIVLHQKWNSSASEVLKFIKKT